MGKAALQSHIRIGAAGPHFRHHGGKGKNCGKLHKIESIEIGSNKLFEVVASGSDGGIVDLEFSGNLRTTFTRTITITDGRD